MMIEDLVVALEAAARVAKEFTFEVHHESERLDLVIAARLIAMTALQDLRSTPERADQFASVNSGLYVCGRMIDRVRESLEPPPIVPPVLLPAPESLEFPQVPRRRFQRPKVSGSSVAGERTPPESPSDDVSVRMVESPAE